MFAGLSDRLSGIFDKLTRRGILTETAVDETMREIKIALLEADVALPVVKDFIAKVKEKAVGEQIVKSVSPAQMVTKIVSDELIALLGDGGELKLSTHPAASDVILMVGLQGAGKTTSAGKLALRLKKNGKKVLLASLDIYRPAAMEQLAELGQKNGLDVLEIIKGQKPEEITRRALQESKSGLYDVLILDTAGRLHIDEEMMNEVERVRDIANPTETLLTVDSMMGQDAVHVAKEFSEKIGITGVVLTRIDGDARGGAALSMRSVTGQPIKFLGVGEKADALEVFDAKRIADRILGMGDVVGLVETAMEKVNQEEAEKTAMRMMEGRFDLNDLLSQLRQINNLGDIKGVMKMIPGLSKFRDKIDSADINNKSIKHQEAIILSMTPYERKHPDVLKASRKQRIANGAGVSVMEVNRLLKQYDQMATVMKQFKKAGPFGMLKMMKQMKNMMGGNMPDLGNLGGMGGFGGSNPFGSMGNNPFGGSMPDMNSPEMKELMKKFPKF